MKKVLIIAIAIGLTGFGLATLFLSSAVIFDLFGIQAKQEKYVPSIVWTNFTCSLIYLVSAYGLFKRKSWSSSLLGIASMILIAA